MGRLGYYSKLSGQAPQESDPPKNFRLRRRETDEDWNQHLESGINGVVQKVDSTIRCINLYPVDKAIGFPDTYPLDSDLSSG